MTERVLEIRFEVSLHHGSGLGIAGLIDRAVLRDASTPYGQPPPRSPRTRALAPPSAPRRSTH